MKKEDFEKLQNSIQEKLGKENSSLIADDLGTLLTDNATVNASLDAKDKEIEKLKKDKENLITTNGKLLQQVSMNVNFENEEQDKEDGKKSKPFNFKKAFDEKGNFIDS